MLLPYFDCVPFHVIDPIDNLFTGTAKHIMKNVWLDVEKPVLDKKDLDKDQDKMDKLKVPAGVGRMPKKIENSYGGFTADQWKSFTVLFSIYALWDILPRNDLKLWRDFVMACSYLCCPVITEMKALLAHSYLLKFVRILNSSMHLYSHLVDCVLDYGPVHSFWRFSFECYNGILGEFGTNQRAVEIQLMRKFTSSQYMNDLHWPVAFQSVFKPLLTRLVSKQSGSLHEQS